jgi:hypothetical protein
VINRPVWRRGTLCQHRVVRYFRGDEWGVLLLRLFKVHSSTAEGLNVAYGVQGNMRSFCLLLMESSALGPCRIPLHVPSRMSMLQTLGRCECKIALETTGLLSGHMRIFVLRSLAAGKLDSLCGSFEIWDLGSMEVDRRLGRPPPAPPPSSSARRLHDCARLAQTLWIDHLRRGRGYGSKHDICRPRKLRLGRSRALDE